MLEPFDRRTLAILGSAIVAVGLPACSAGESSGAEPDARSPEAGVEDAVGNDTSDTNSDSGDTPQTTYHADVAPIIEARCTKCHVKGGIGPFPLTTYKEVDSVARQVLSAVQDAEMPPHLANDTCRDYKYDTSLTDEQIQTIADWVEAGTPEGDPSVDPEPLPSASPELSEVDLRLGVPKPYKPRRSPDDYRCFPIDWPADEKKFVTGFGVDPDEREIAHHAIAYVLGPSLSDEVDQKAASEEGPGYTCFGGTKVGDLYPQGAVRWLGAWAPGNRGSDLPEGTGIPVKPGSTVVLQMHYNTLTADPRLDETEVVVNTDTSAETTGQYFPFTNPKWLQNEDAMKIPAGAPDVTHEWTFDVASYLGEPIKIHRAMLHMHKLGEAGRLWVDHSEGSEECLLGISNWDFDWQRTYSFQKPVSIQPGDEVGIQCTWDNTLSNQPVFNGQRQQPRDVSWGQGTTDEMCLGIFYVTLGK